jgi:hypothetical protein
MLKQQEVIKRLKLKAGSYNEQDIKASRLRYDEQFGRYNVPPLSYKDIAKYIEELGTLGCFYCGKNTKIIPLRKKDPLQFTLERLDNSKTHTIGNCVIACLMCNEGRSNKFSVKVFGDMMHKAQTIKPVRDYSKEMDML